MVPDVSASDLEMLTRMVYFSSEARMAKTTPAELRRIRGVATLLRFVLHTEIGKKAGLFAKLQPGRARKRINAT